MKTSQFKKILKEAVREVFQEEIKEILFEALKSPKNTIVENQQFSPQSPSSGAPQVDPSFNSSDFRNELRSGYAKLIENSPGAQPQTNPTLHDPNGYQVSRYVNTAGPNTELPPGEVSFDQISALIQPKN